MPRKPSTTEPALSELRKDMTGSSGDLGATSRPVGPRKLGPAVHTHGLLGQVHTFWGAGSPTVIDQREEEPCSLRLQTPHTCEGHKPLPFHSTLTAFTHTDVHIQTLVHIYTLTHPHTYFCMHIFI